MKNDSRDLILSRLRQCRSPEIAQPPDIIADKLVYTDVETEENILLERFRRTLEELHGEFFLASNLQETGKILLDLLAEFSDSGCLSNKFKLLQDVCSIFPELRSKIDMAAHLSMPSVEFASYPCAITHADYLIARTGSIVVTSLSGGGRRLSILPPIHIVLAYRSQLVPSLENVWKNLADRPQACSSLSIITGPSRTSDIEKELVLGAHGPKRLVVIVVSEHAD